MLVSIASISRFLLIYHLFQPGDSLLNNLVPLNIQVMICLVEQQALPHVCSLLITSRKTFETILLCTISHSLHILITVLVSHVLQVRPGLLLLPSIQNPQGHSTPAFASCLLRHCCNYSLSTILIDSNSNVSS